MRLMDGVMPQTWMDGLDGGRISDVIAGLDAAVDHWLGLSSGGGEADVVAATGATERPPVVLTLSLVRAEMYMRG